MGRESREIEVKYRVSTPQQLEPVLSRCGWALSAAVRQDDQAYAEVRWQYGMSKLGIAFARLRTEGRRHTFTLKKPQENEMACLEHETEVADRDQMHAALLHMGFYPTVRIIKSRRTARSGQVSVCVDEVEHIGTFLELERLIGPDESAVAVQAELNAVAESLGLDIERTGDTYDSLVHSALSV